MNRKSLGIVLGLLGPALVGWAVANDISPNELGNVAAASLITPILGLAIFLGSIRRFFIVFIGLIGLVLILGPLIANADDLSDAPVGLMVAGLFMYVVAVLLHRATPKENTIEISHTQVSGDFSQKVAIYNDPKENILLLSAGSDTYQLPKDLSSWSYQTIERDEENIGLQLVKLGLGAAAGGLTAKALDGRGKTFLEGAAAAVLGATSLRIDTIETNQYVLVNLQFNDKKILSLELNGDQWMKFDEYQSLTNFSEYEQETNAQKSQISEWIEDLRSKYMSLEPAEQAEASELLSNLSLRLTDIDKVFDHRKQIYESRQS